MNKIDQKDRIEIALLSAMLAHDVLGLAKLTDSDLIKISFSQVIESLKALDKSIKKATS